MPTLTLSVRGTYTRLRGERVGHSGGGPRGRVFGFSRDSRKRLLDVLNMVDAALLGNGLFLTLTYPDVFPADAHQWKRHLDVWCKRLRREYPRASVVWRLEWKERLSGVNRGKIAPHFHLLVTGVPRVSLEWLSRSWYETVGSGDIRHLQAGTSGTRVRNRRAMMSYASKYIAKIAEETFGGWTGRVWGVVNRRGLGIILRTYELTWAQFYRIRRVFRSWLESKRGRRSWARLRGQGITAYLDAETSGAVLAWAGVF
jgi:hypothetical protein